MNKTLPYLNVVSYITLIIVNILAVRIPLFGKSPGDVSDLYPTLLTPVDLTFRIWSIIYALLGIFIFVQAYDYIKKQKAMSNEVKAIGVLFSASCLLNIVWLFLWQSLYISFAFASIFILWLLLMYISYKLALVENASLIYTIPFSVYFAWISIATLAALNVLLINLDIPFMGFEEQTWTIAWLALGVLGTLLFQYLNNSIWFTLVIIWAYFGIYLKNKQLSIDDNFVVYACIIAMTILAVSALITGWTKSKTKLAA